MRRRWWWVVAGVAAGVLLAVGALVVYTQFIREDAPPELTFLDVTTTTAHAGTADPTGPAGATTVVGGGPATTAPVTPPADGVDGRWVTTEGSTVGYRVVEDFVGGIQNFEAVGRTTAVDGGITIDGTTVPVAEFTADLRTLRSDDSRRDRQVQGRILDTAAHPTATFRLTQPIEFGQVPAEGQEVTVTATGELTLRGVSRPVTFEVRAKLDADRVQVLGQIPIVFADWGIPNPSNPIVTTRDEGVLEFLLVLTRA